MAALNNQPEWAEQSIKERALAAVELLQKGRLPGAPPKTK